MRNHQPEERSSNREERPGDAGRSDTTPTEATTAEAPASGDDRRWVLTLYVIGGGSLASSGAIAAIRRICTTELAGRVSLEIIDIHKHPEALEADHVLAVPTLIKRLPPPLRRIVGDLSDAAILRAALDLDPLPPD